MGLRAIPLRASALTEAAELKVSPLSILPSQITSIVFSPVCVERVSESFLSIQIRD